jgi:hypothetical protein
MSVSNRITMKLWRGRQPLLVLTLSTVGLIIAESGAVFAQAIHPGAIQQVQDILQEKMSRTPAQQKLDSHVHLAAQAARGVLNSSMMPSLPRMVDTLKFDTGGNVHVDIRGTVTPALEAEIVAQGGTIESSFPNYGAIRAWIPLAAAETLAARADVAFIKPAAQAMTNTRPIDTKALVSHGADLVLNQGVTGSGVKVGVLSDGVKSLATLQAAGNLPASVTVLSGQGGPASGDEGTAMLEIVSDLAPGAQLYFATAFTGEAQFATNIQNLAAAGAKIIVDDVTYFDEPAFQDGIIAQAVNTVTANGVIYLSSAGNSGNLDSNTSGTWQGDFVDSGTSIPVINAQEGQVVKVHAFDATHNYNQVTVASSRPTTLKWSDPSGAACNDYDLFILDSTMTTVLAFSNNFQTCTQDPYEHVAAPAAGNRIVVVLYNGAARALNVVTNRGRLAINTSGATFGHNAAAAAVTVAATPAQSTIFTNGNQSPETYSSDGPRKIFYNPNGTAITPGNFLFATGGGTTLSKADLTAADCGQSAVSGFNPFCGTSAAAPGAAAIAALVWSADPALTPSAVVNRMKSTALAAHSGFGSRTVGSGIVMANLAVQAQTPGPNYAAVLPLSRSVRVGGSPATAFAAIINSGTATALNCAPAPPSSPPAGLGTFSYQTTTAANVLTGTPNTPANIAAGAIQNYVFGFFPTGAIPETSLAMLFTCSNAADAPQTPGVNNFFIVANTSSVPDTVAQIATISGDGVVRIPSSSSTQLFAIGTSNVGATGTIVVSADAGGLPLALTVCETTGGSVCLALPTPTVTVNYLAGTNRSFAFFAQASGSIAFDPANNRIFARLKEAGVLRGATSAAVCTKPNAGC